MGETALNNMGSVMFIVEYTTSMNIRVQFDDGYITSTTYWNFQNGLVRNPNDINVYGVGKIGSGKYKAIIKGECVAQYLTWNSMLDRCYSARSKVKRPAYKGCTVSEEWLNYQNFAKWYDDNYYELEGQEMALDKDILIKGNRIYSKDTCIFVPRNINSLFIGTNNKRDNLPIGVQLLHDGRFMAMCSSEGKAKNLGRFNTATEAFGYYKEYKESYIKLVADMYKGVIPSRLYDAMYRYEITS